MDIQLAKSAGFCPGVKRADEAVKSLIKAADSKIFTLGELIHNRLYNTSLEKLGVYSTTIEEISDLLQKNPNQKTTLVFL